MVAILNRVLFRSRGLFITYMVTNNTADFNSVCNGNKECSVETVKLQLTYWILKYCSFRRRKKLHRFEMWENIVFRKLLNIIKDWNIIH